MEIKERFEKFINSIEKNSLNVLEIVLWDNGSLFEHKFNGVQDELYQVYSISKIITGLGIMKAIELKLITLETPIMKYFSDIEIYNKNNLAYLNELKIKHLLTLTLGQEKTLVNEEWIKLNSNLNEDYVSAVLNYPINHRAGTYFFYSNANNYLLSAIIQKITNKNFSDFVNEHIFNPLDISEWKWRNCKFEICLGATGLYLKIKDILKIGLLLLNNGKYKNKQIINSKLIRDMKQEKLPREIVNYKYISPVFPKWAYGYNLWLTNDGNYFVDGREGQFLIIQPKQKRIIITLSQTTNEQMRQIVNCMEILKG